MVLGGVEVFLGSRALRAPGSTSGLVIAFALIVSGSIVFWASTRARRASEQAFARSALASAVGVLVVAVSFIRSHSRGQFSALSFLALGIGLASFVLSGLSVAELRKRNTRARRVP
jgi:uncharacterized membrane protein